MTVFDVPVEAMREHLRGLYARQPWSVDAWDDDAVEQRWARTIWSAVLEPGDGVAGALIDAIGAGTALQFAANYRLGAQGMSQAELSAAHSAGVSARALRDGLERWRPRCEAPAIHTMFAAAQRAGAHFVTADDDEWPTTIDDLGVHRPVGLWVRGNPATLSGPGPAIALVGARAATSYGEHVAMELAADLVGRGARIVSGAAYGIDGMAHRAALAAGGTTVAFLAGGVDRPYPAGHADLLEQIAATGAVVSEVAPGTAPTKWRFLQRNRLIAACAHATVVVEAGWRSGSLNTAHHAAALGRPLSAVPGPVTSAASAGCHRLLREMDAQCVTSGDDVWELIESGRAAVDGALFDDTLMPESDSPRTDDTSRVLDALSTRSWRSSIDIAQRSGLGVTEVEGLLGLLSLENRVERGEPGWRAISPTRRAEARG